MKKHQFAASFSLNSVSQWFTEVWFVSYASGLKWVDNIKVGKGFVMLNNNIDCTCKYQTKNPHNKVNLFSLLNKW